MLEKNGDSQKELRLEVKNFNFYYGQVHALKNIDLLIERNKAVALIGPSGCGKSTLLRAMNRMHDLYPGNRYEGQMILYPEKLDIVSPKVDPIEVRMKISMVFQKPNPFPKSIFENVAYGLKIRGIKDKDEIGAKVKKSLENVGLWNEVKNRLNQSAIGLSGGQQQRLCIARALATDPDIILFDEPTSALDPIATAKIEELVNVLKKEVTIVIVTHNMQQAARVSDYTAFMYLGELIEIGETKNIFTRPSKKLTEEYITGHFG